MPWLNNVLAFPYIGIRIKTKLTSVNALRDSFGPLLDYLETKYGVIDIKQADLWGYSLTPKFKSGFCYRVVHNDILVNYNYKIIQRTQLGSFPFNEIPEIIPYTDLLYQNLDEIKRVFSLLRTVRDITYDRIGIVAEASLAKDNFPPGVIAWIDHLGKPWGNIVKIESSLLSKISEVDAYYDQCHHILNFDVLDLQKEIIFKLDYQRIFKVSVGFNYGRISTDITSCLDKALEYFEKFGEGDLKL